MNLKEALRRAEDRLARAGIADAKNDAWLLLQHVTCLRRADYFLSPEKELPGDKQNIYFGLVEERAGHRPLQYITGTQDFMGLTFHVNEHVLIPRQDTELLVEKAIEILSEEFATGNNKTAGERRNPVPRKNSDSETNGTSSDFRILDLCTGSGCIAVSLAVWAAKNSWPAEITATDISEEALAVARKNAGAILTDEQCGERENLRFCQGDLYDAVGGETFRMILSNPPYIRSDEIAALMPEVRDFEPRTALDGEADGLAFYRKIAAGIPTYLKKGGTMLLEIGCDEASEVSKLLSENGLCDIRVYKDYAGLDRVVYGKYEPA